MRMYVFVLVLVSVLSLWMAPAIDAESTAAVLDIRGRSQCQVTVTNSQNPMQYPDGVYYFDMELLFNSHIYCNTAVSGWMYVGTWMGV